MKKNPSGTTYDALVLFYLFILSSKQSTLPIPLPVARWQRQLCGSGRPSVPTSQLSCTVQQGGVVNK